MMLISLILLVFAFVLFVVAAFLVPEHPWKGKLGLLGLACWVLAELLRGLPGAAHGG